MKPAPLDPAEIATNLGTTTLPRTIRCYGSIGSTMDLARELLARAETHALPAIIVADEQTAGRGRMGRHWVAPPGTALLTSLALRPYWLPPSQGVALVWMAAVALCEAVEDVTPLHAALKWPNDVLVPLQGGRDQEGMPERAWAKTAGILLEAAFSESVVDWAIIGCGVNITAAPPAGTTRYPATCLADAAGQAVSRMELLRALLRRADTWYGRLAAGRHDELYAAWQGRLTTLGTEVRIDTPGGPVEGLAEAVGPDGALLVRDRQGALQTVTAGDVGLVG